MRGFPRRLTALAAVAFALPSLSGCGADRTGDGPGPATAQIVERDFRIKAPKQLPAGDVRLTLHNRGPAHHELALIRGAAPLPLRADGLTVDEDALKPREVEGLEPAEAGKTRYIHVNLAPGRYQMLCNMSGHYLGGMHVKVTVR
jgi:uncharacterized cupredoxin-like copper-binding protein